MSSAQNLPSSLVSIIEYRNLSFNIIQLPNQENVRAQKFGANLSLAPVNGVTGSLALDGAEDGELATKLFEVDAILVDLEELVHDLVADGVQLNLQGDVFEIENTSIFPIYRENKVIITSWMWSRSSLTR